MGLTRDHSLKSVTCIPPKPAVIGLMKAYFIRHIAGRVENRLIKLPPRRMLHTEVQILRGGLFIPDNSVIYCTNKGNFAPVASIDKKIGAHPIYQLDLGFEKLKIVMIPDGIETYFIDLKTWQRHKQRTLVSR